MTKAEAGKLILTGEKIHVVEYRGSVAESIQWRDKTTRAVMRGVTLTHNCESGKNAFVVSERVEENFNPVTFVSPHTKGDRVALLYNSCKVEAGKTTYYGTIQKLEGPEAQIVIK